MSRIPQHIAERIANHLDAIKSEFIAPKVTLLVRATNLPDGTGDLLMTDDAFDEITVALKRRMDRADIDPKGAV